jgi:hypothetical protein
MYKDVMPVLHYAQGRVCGRENRSNQVEWSHKE